MNFAVGARVRVQIKRPEEYATGSAEALEGALGTVEAYKPHNKGGEYLVRFDEARPKWWTHQTPATAFHFPARDLAAL